MRKERIRNLAGVLAFYLILILGVVVLNARMEHLNNINTSTNINFTR